MRCQRRPAFYWILLFLFTSILTWTQFRQKQRAMEFYQMLRLVKKSDGTSLCSDKAMKAGFNQKVISFSLYVTKGQEELIAKRGYVKGINLNAQKIRELYPGWSMRIYTNQLNLFQTNSEFYELIQADDVFICDVTAIPIIGDISKILEDGMLWRVLALFDPTVDIFLSRDLDSIVNKRERAAVAQWETSDLTFHTMRDHFYHMEFIMGGLWGAKTVKLNEKTKELIAEKISHVIFGLKSRNDQDILKMSLYSQFPATDFMTHDSYHCQIFPNTAPFPTQRENKWDFVGAYLTNKTGVDIKCPEACRPSYGKDWEYC